MKITRELLAALPKTELHCHLDGSLRVSTAFELGRELGLTDAGSAEELVEFYSLGAKHDSLEEYLKAFSFTCSLMQEEKYIRRICRELVEDARAENILHLEVRYAPMLHTNGGLDMAEVHRIVCDELKNAGEANDVSTTVIVATLRHLDARQSTLDASAAVLMKKMLTTAYDLAGPENGFPPSNHAAAINLARKNGLRVTIHAGEADGAASVWDALLNGAERLGHGVRLVEDACLLKYVADRQIGVEACLTSNVQTSAVGALKDHPLPLFLEKGIAVSLCTDNRLVSATTLTDEYVKAAETFDLSPDQIATLSLNGFRTAFAPLPRKRELTQKAAKQIKELFAKNDLHISESVFGF